MLRESFTESATGDLIKIPEGIWAFVPDPLPPQELSVSWELTTLISEADRALSELVGLAKILPNAHLLTGSFMRREAVLSSRIEGTQTTVSELFLFEAGVVESEASDAREVANYLRAIEYGMEQLKTLPVCKRLIKDIHKILMEGVRGEDKTPGEFRTKQNYIAPQGSKIEDATYVPPPVKEMQKCLDEFDKYINSQSRFPPLINQALIHYQFEAIHPFLDGNGRIGRLLLTLNLCAEGIVPHPLLYLSAYIERHKDEYYKLLLGISTHGAWEEWFLFYLRGVIEESRDAIKRANKLHELMQSYRQKLETSGASTVALRLLAELFDVPAINTTQVKRLLGVTTKTALHAIDRLVREDILREVKTGRQRNKIYYAKEIITIASE